MRKQIIYIILISNCLNTYVFGQNKKDSISVKKSYNLEEVVITGTRNETDIRHLPMTVSIVNNEQIRSRYEQSLLPVLTELVPGFFTTSRGLLGYGVSTGAAGGMSLRGVGGSPTAGLLVLIDGHPQYMGLMGHPIADAYQSMLADRVEVLRGPASVLYGSNAMGGVINIVTPVKYQDEVNSNVRISYGSYNTLMTEGVNRLYKGRFSSIVTASYNRTDGHRKDMKFEQYGGYTKLGYNFSNIWKTFADVNITHFNASNPGAVTNLVLDNDSRITRGMASFSLENNYRKTSGALKFFYNWGRHNINDGYKNGELPKDYKFNSKDLMLGITWYQSINLFQGNRITLGIDYQHFGGDAWNQFADKRMDIADKSENEIAGYVSMRQSLGHSLTFDIGLRADHHSVTGTEWIPQGGLALQLSRSSELKAMISKGFRNPTIRELYMFVPQNPDLLPERLINYELSYSQRLLNNTFSYGLNLFYINGDNIIQTLPVNGRPMNINTGKIENWGIETNVAYQINSSWKISTNYSWLRMVYPVVAAPKHKLYVGVNYSKGKWNVSTGLQYVNGLYTSVTPEKEECFTLWNLRGSYRLHPRIDLFVRGENLLAQRYEINVGYPLPKATCMGGINLNF
ncbi:TonB-dependent receptor [Dysgonomonas sp. Marseille-P4677]|uniref:TonB-dependent receptor plug domain-containing protein n=1 Tax=Dysgonomonas sp. Marseille-P4677 TaxID=2364790 RepID=UPI0019131D30|nr:TonB-dependent receptor [Dysgonomonas sp. Marseille-P4677]MBK5722794.1 TonB-dependent receptor [Dysgonomonas sp. Marseille-P4677]